MQAYTPIDTKTGLSSHGQNLMYETVNAEKSNSKKTGPLFFILVWILLALFIVFVSVIVLLFFNTKRFRSIYKLVPFLNNQQVQNSKSQSAVDQQISPTQPVVSSTPTPTPTVSIEKSPEIMEKQLNNLESGLNQQEDSTDAGAVPDFNINL